MGEKHLEDVARLRQEEQGKKFEEKMAVEFKDYELDNIPTDFIERLDAIPYYIGKGDMTHVEVVDAFGLDYDEGSALQYIIRRGARNGMKGDNPQRRNAQGDLEKAIWHLNRKLLKL